MGYGLRKGCTIDEKNVYLLRLRGEIVPVAVEISVRDFVSLFLSPFFETQLPVVHMGINIAGTERVM